MEQPFTVTTPDNADISACLHPSSDARRPLVVLVHGLTGHMDEYIHLRLARLLNSQGYPVIRFNQYGQEERARKFYTSTIREHVLDTQCILTYAANAGYTSMVLAGHSLGSPVAIAATDESVSGLILIDPTGRPRDRIKDWETYDPERKISYFARAQRILLGERWIEDAKSFPDSYQQFSRISCPVQIIAAQKADQMKFCERYREAHPRHPEIQIIPNATHCFPEEGAVEVLASMMIQWMVTHVGGTTGHKC